MTHLPKHLRDALDDFDVESFDYYIRKGDYATLVRLYDLVAERYKSGIPLNEFHQEVLLLPFKKWGNQAGRVMFEMKKAYWDYHQNKQPKPSREEIKEQQRKEFESRFAVTSK